MSAQVNVVVISIVLMSQESVMFWFLKSQYLKRKSILQRKCFVLRNIIRIVTRTLWRPKCGAWEGLMPPSVGVLLVAVCLLLKFRVKYLTNLFVSPLISHLCTKRLCHLKVLNTARWLPDIRVNSFIKPYGRPANLSFVEHYSLHLMEIKLGLLLLPLFLCVSVPF